MFSVVVTIYPHHVRTTLYMKLGFHYDINAIVLILGYLMFEVLASMPDAGQDADFERVQYNLGELRGGFTHMGTMSKRQNPTHGSIGRIKLSLRSLNTLFL